MEQIVHTIQGTFSPDANTRMAAELAISKMFGQPDAGLALASLTVTDSVDPAIRQAAGVLTRKYVIEYWSPYFSQFKGPAPSVQTKQQIRETIFKGLADPNRKIRSAAAYIISTIAHSDWPDEYPDLFNNLIAALSVSPDSVNGSLQVFAEFMKNDLTEDQITPVLRQLLPALLQVLGQPQIHSFTTRARTVVVFRQCVVGLVMLKAQYPEATKEASSSVLPTWLDAFRVLLEADPRADVADATNWDALSVKIQIFKTLNSVVASFPSTLDTNLAAFITATTNHLVALAPAYATYYLAADGPAAPISEEDPEGVTVPALVAPAFDFLGALVRKGRIREWLQKPEHVQALVSSIIIWAQITQEDESKWEDNPNTFVAEDDDDAQGDNLRASSFELLMSLLDKTPVPAIGALNAILASTVEESNAQRQAGNPIWWKPLEALLAALGSASESLLDHKDHINLNVLFTTVIPSLLTLRDTPFIAGRAFVFASRFSRALPAELAQQYLASAAEVLEGDGGVVMKISAVKAIRNFCQNTTDTSVTGLAPRILTVLGPFLSASEDTLSLVTETIVAVLSVDNGKWVTPELTSMLANALLDVWVKNVKDPILLSVLTDAFTELAKTQYATTVSTAVPRLCSTITNLQPGEIWVAASAVEIISSIFRGAPAGTGLGDGVFAQLAPAIFGALNTNEDRDLLQNGIICLTLFVRKDTPQILAYPEGLNMLLALISRTLAPADGNESGGLVVGDLMLHLLRRAGPALLPSLNDLVRALLERLTTAKTGTFIQSLVVPFAYLLYTQRDPVLDLLEGTTLQNGSNGLQVLLTAWCENAETFVGYWAQRLSNLALSVLFASERPSVQSITVRGDLVVKPETSNVIMTRSRSKQIPHEYTAVPFPVKALKLLLHDLQSGGDAAAISAAANLGVELVDSDDDGTDWADEEKVGEEKWLSDLLGPGEKGFEDDDVVEEDDDADFADDPISQIDMKEHLINFLKECAARNTNNFSAIAENHLKLEETLVIQHALQSA